MKYLSILSLFLLLFGIRSQSQKMAKIELSVHDCRTSNRYLPVFRDTIRFYKLPEDTFAFKVAPVRLKPDPIHLENIGAGDYKLVYINNFRQAITRDVHIDEQGINRINICADSMPDYSLNTLSELRDRDTISIHFSSRGCFNYEVRKLTITKEGNQYTARLYYVSPYYVKKKGRYTIRYGADSLINTVTLTEANMLSFTRFENELNFVTDGGCTTTDSYDVKSPYRNVKKTDGSCQWNGFYYLRQSIFGEKN